MRLSLRFDADSVERSDTASATAADRSGRPIGGVSEANCREIKKPQLAQRAQGPETKNVWSQKRALNRT